MGCDIHAYAEVKRNGKWEFVKEVWDIRHYGLFGWLADVRNYSGITPLANVQEGVPDDASQKYLGIVEDWNTDGHTHSWVNLDYLLLLDYDRIIWDRRVTR